MPWWLIIIAGIAALFLLTVVRGAPYVPTHRRQLQQAFKKVYPLSDKDLLIDIGSGDGVVLRQAAKQGAHALGYEINPVLVIVSRVLSRRFGKKITVKLADFWFAKFPAQTTIVYTFGESRDINRMYAKVEAEAVRLQKPLYFMSYGFQVKDQQATKNGEGFWLYRISPGKNKKLTL